MGFSVISLNLTSFKGFTLAELLIALAILGEIATFTIPKILSSQQNQQKKMILKENIATLEQITYLKIYLGGDTTSESRDIYLDNLNALRVCKTNPVTEGCYTTGGTEGGALMHNGSVIGGLASWNYGGWGGAGCKVEGMFIDYNGDQLPNINGEDRINLVINVSNQTCNDVPPKKIRLSTSFAWSAAQQTLWDSLW